MLTWPVGPLAKVKEFCEEEVVPLFDKSYWSELALISLSAGVGEEMLFRGVLQASFTDWLGSGGGLALASILFGVLHPISVSYIFIAGFLGFYLGAIWIYQRQSPDGHGDSRPLRFRRAGLPDPAPVSRR